MRVLVQRVTSSSVLVEGKTISEIGKGLNLLVGIKKGDSFEVAKKMAQKVVKLRIFEDENGKIRHSILDVGGSILVVSQFTLYANLKKGNRPSFELSEEYHRAKEVYEYFVNCLKEYNLEVKTGIFGANMLVKIENDGPFTLLLEMD